MSTPFGTFVRFEDLTGNERELVVLAQRAAQRSADHRLCFNSDFPVGAAIMARSSLGAPARFYSGCNVENRWFPATICAERNAALQATFEGSIKFDAVAVFCLRVPGGSPCGLCRSVLNQFGRGGILLNVVEGSNVYRSYISDLLPSAKAIAVDVDRLDSQEKRLVRRVLALRSRAHVPYSKEPRAALFVAHNDAGRRRIFEGVSDDNASYGGSALAETVAMRSARTAGFTKNVRLLATCTSPHGPAPLDGESLQVLREFSPQAPIVLVGNQGNTVNTSLTELLPDSFGPNSL